MNDKVVAINSVALDKQLLEIIDYSNEIKTIFNSIDVAMERLKNSYQCAAATTLYNQYEQFNDNYPIIIDNILSYNSDLMALKKTYLSKLGDLTEQIDVSTHRMEANVLETKMKERL